MKKLLFPALICAGSATAFALKNYKTAEKFFAGYFCRPSSTEKMMQDYLESPLFKASLRGIKLMRKIPHRDIEITARDGITLKAKLFPCENSKKFIIGLHGYQSSPEAAWSPFIEFYREKGYSMLTPDMRAHGKSGGTYMGLSVLDRFDCILWAEYLIKTYGPDIEIILHGVSMGAATAISASSEASLPPQVKAVISDCSFAYPSNVVSYEMKHMAHIPVKPVLPFVELICKVKAGYGFHNVTPLKQISKTKIPVLFVQGEEDEMVSVSMAQLLYDTCPAPKKILFVPRARHLESIVYAKNEYEKAISEFIINGNYQSP